MLILLRCAIFQVIPHLNTSHVNVNRIGGALVLPLAGGNLNTSHVNVNLMGYLE